MSVFVLCYFGSVLMLLSASTDSGSFTDTLSSTDTDSSTDPTKTGSSMDTSVSSTTTEPSSSTIATRSSVTPTTHNHRQHDNDGRLIFCPSWRRRHTDLNPDAIAGLYTPKPSQIIRYAPHMRTTRTTRPFRFLRPSPFSPNTIAQHFAPQSIVNTQSHDRRNVLEISMTVWGWGHRR